MAILVKPTLTQTFLERAKRDADRVGFSYKPTFPEDGPPGMWKDVTYKQFHEAVRAVSYGLRSLGIARGDRVAIISNTRFEWSLCDLAIIATGAVSVPVYASNTEKDAAFIVEHSESKVAIVEDANQLEKLLKTDPRGVSKIVVIEPAALSLVSDRPESAAKVITLAQLIQLGVTESASDPHLFERDIEKSQPSDLITICYTSGTTGVPKGAMLTHENVMSVLEDAVSVFAKHVDPAKDSVLSFLPFSHILGRVESMAVYVFGWKQYFAENLDKLMINIEQTQPTLIFAVPRVFEKAYARIQAALSEGGEGKRKLASRAVATGRDYHHARRMKRKPSLRVALEHALYDKLVFSKVREKFGGKFRFALCGGAPLPKEIGEFFQIAGIQVLEGYGLTETTGPVTLNTPDDTRYGTVGRPLPEVSVKVAQDGEILIQSRKVFKEYFKTPGETAEVFQDGWFRTGDIGYVDSDGFVHITDRKKDILVTSAGKNVAPQKIESLAKSHKFISQFVVHGDRRHFLAALITLERDQVIKYANEQQILFSAYSELVNHPKIHTLVQRAIDDVNSHLAQYESIKRFVILPDEFTVEGGELTPSLKVKRRFVDQKYRSALDSMYAP